MNDTLHHTLRGLDPAVTPADLDPSTHPAAQTLLTRITATDPTHPGTGDRATPAATATTADPAHPAGTLPPSTRRRVLTTGRLATLTGGLALGTAAALLLPGIFGGGSAIAAWTATPHTITGDRATDAQTTCLDSAHDAAQRTTGRPLDFRPVVTEGRGPWTLVYVNDNSSHLAEITCLLLDGDLIGTHGSTPGPDARPLAPVPAGSARAALGAVLSTSEESVRTVTGRVGDGVVGVELVTEARGTVTATVAGGYFAAWWPDAPTTEARENASPRGGVSGVTVILQDGTRHEVSLEDLTGRTTTQLNTAATGGSTGD
ncbi:hypothetical protein ACIBH1_12565 [Nonomuraea sp. NPDC050663]|uniref:hypothetical protein n=1 Tax=Nonomuraea sp. NPDC050663 TaxID=3364370 RepID=UPI0037A2219D